MLLCPFWAIPAPQTLLSGAFFLKQLGFLLPRQSYHLQILSTFRAGSMGNCSRNTWNSPSLPLSFCCLVFSLGLFFFSQKISFQPLTKPPEIRAKNSTDKKTNSIIIFLQAREIIARRALLLLPSPRKVLRAGAAALSGGA